MARSAAQDVRDQVNDAPMYSFLRTERVRGPRRAVESELSRLVARGQLRRVHRGLYWKAPRTRYGTPHPRPEQVAREAAGASSGPCGVSAAHLWGLTTQVPAVVEFAVPARIPEVSVPGVRFHARPAARLTWDLSPQEVAAVELLREFDQFAEGRLEDLADRLRDAEGRGDIRLRAITGVAASERHRGARERLGLLLQHLDRDVHG